MNLYLNTLVGIIAWRGRYCAFSYSSFERFMRYILAQVTGQPVPEPDPWDPDVTLLLRTFFILRCISSYCDSVIYECTMDQELERIRRER